MEKDRIEGAAKQAKAPSRRPSAKWWTMPSWRREGEADQTEGSLQNAVGGLKDTLRKA